MKNLYRFSLAAKSSPENRDRWLPFYIHSLDTAAVMERLCRMWLPEAWKNAVAEVSAQRELERLCAFLGLLHDIGKLIAAFQYQIGQYIPHFLTRLRNSGLLSVANVQPIPHARAGQVILLKYGIPVGIAVIVGSHHGVPQDEGVWWKQELWEAAKENAYYGGHDPASKEVWESIWEDWISFAMERCGYRGKEELPKLGMESQMLLSGLLIMADWIASNDAYFPLLDLEETLDDTQIEQRIQTAWDALQLPLPWMPFAGGFDFEQRFGFSPRPMQARVGKILEQCGQMGLCILEAPMGCGKTEAALAGAELLAERGRCSGIFFGLPTQATGNGIFSRLIPWAEGQSEDTHARYAIQLAHGNALLNEDYQQLMAGTTTILEEEDAGLMVHQWFQGRKKALLSTFVVGTVDQVLMASLKQKHLMLRHLGLAGKTVIIDECHAYDAYMSRYLERTLRWLGAYRVPVILLSATLPAQRRAALVDAYLGQRQSTQEPWRICQSYPLLTWTDGGSVYQEQLPADADTLRVTVDKLSEDALTDMLADKLKNGGCACVLVNTVKKAQSIFEELQVLRQQGMEVQLYHSRFLTSERTAREAELMRRVGKDSNRDVRDRLIVIGTQVLEQSLDLDFDVIVSQLCPMDLLLQRMGRLHRHRGHDHLRTNELKDPQFFILEHEAEPWDRGSEAVYGKWLLLRTHQFLPDEVVLPKDIPGLVHQVYSEPEHTALTDEQKEAWEAFMFEQRDRSTRAEAFCIPEPRRKWNEAANPRRRPQPGSIAGILQQSVGSDERTAEATVRDGDPSLDVLVVVLYNDGRIRLISGENAHIRLLAGEIPDFETARRIAGERLRLPREFCTAWRIRDTIAELETMTNQVSAWQRAPLLKGELFLLLDETRCATLCGKRLEYQEDMGLRVIEEGTSCSPCFI